MDSFNTLQSFKHGKLHSLPALGKNAGGENRKTPGLDAHRARVGAAQLRRQEGHRGARPGAGQLAAERQAHRGDPVRAGEDPAPGLHRRAAAGRPRRHAQRGAEDGQEPENHRAAGAGRPGGRPLGADRPLRQQERARPQHEARIQAQRGALPVHEVGHAGVRHLQGGAAGHRHRAPGEPRIPGARRAQVEGRPCATRTRWSAPTAIPP